MNSSRVLRLFRTLIDIGFVRLHRRLCYESRQLLDRHLPPRVALLLVTFGLRQPIYSFYRIHTRLPPLPSGQLIPTSLIAFTFLSQERQLIFPFQWNDPKWPRLWQFNLHYFDWAREWLETAVSQGHWPHQAAILAPLLDYWIEANPPGRGDGWHSYTLSLRIRNWIWLFRCCPQIATPLRLQSLWHQLLWLQAHPENCHGGNHWLENLTALAIGGLQFEGSLSLAMHRRAMRLLQQELSCQVLADGGHEERSAHYHIQILDRLVELACTLNERPVWLVSVIQSMAIWARTVRLEGGASPRFNDSAHDSSTSFDCVLSFAYGFLHNRPGSSGLRSHFLKSAGTLLTPPSLPFNDTALSSQVVTDLSDTGWTFLRPGHGWELIFKCGRPCPPHLPAHVHSDQLSVELSFRGHRLFSEAGTSIYDLGPERTFERSGAAHNVLQLGMTSPSGDVEWIEPVEVWGGFRAARKALPRDRDCGTLSDSSCFVSGSHDGFDRIGASHVRHVHLSDVRADQISLAVADTVTTRRSLQFRQWWHLAPSIPKGWIDALAFEAPTAESIQTSWYTTWFSEGFGKRTPRHSFCIHGRLPPGHHSLSITFPLSVAPLSLPPACPASG